MPVRPASAPHRRPSEAKISLARQGALENEVAVLRKRYDELKDAYEVACQERDASRYEVQCLRRDLKRPRAANQCKTCSEVRHRCKQLLASRDLARQECQALKESLSQPVARPCERCKGLQQRLKATEKRLQNVLAQQSSEGAEANKSAPVQIEDSSTMPAVHVAAEEGHAKSNEDMDEIQTLHVEVLEAKCRFEEAEARAEQWRREVEAWREALQSVCRKLTARSLSLSQTQELEESAGPEGTASAALTAALTAEANLKSEHRSTIKKRESEMKAEHRKAFSELEQAAENERKRLQSQIEKQAKQHQDTIQALEEENLSLREKFVHLGGEAVEEMQSENGILKEKIQELEASVRNYFVGAMQDEVSQARGEVKELSRENNVLKMALKNKRSRADDVIEYAMNAAPSAYEPEKSRLRSDFRVSPGHGTSASSRLQENTHISSPGSPASPLAAIRSRGTHIPSPGSPSSPLNAIRSHGTPPSHGARLGSPPRHPTSAVQDASMLHGGTAVGSSSIQEHPFADDVRREWKKRLDEADAWRETMQKFQADANHRVECIQAEHSKEQARMQRELGFAYETMIAREGKRLGNEAGMPAKTKKPAVDEESGLPDWARARNATGGHEPHL
eukprot:gnl/MRDRNA2_/MRDRNA2_61219_c0_seq1.p1 gnl/MRDRNA2_/MRDRNA2_61219_c0~~gnl/MRDRNA2_/MRDRNA2_61219_c0_seq1.p1  ORF type:complete len:623 (-),score=168.58 gnl/MRDRNA2_/MRDRNA2_61219_c0_seq1:170-2038(-)